jgi:predicted MFS family arabinose efflux permease
MTTDSRPAAAQEWRAYGLLVLAAMAGVSLGTIPTATLGLFMAPLQNEFGWSRTEISLGLTIFALVGLPLAPFGGVLVDKFGARRIAIPGLALSAAIFAGFSLLTGAYVQWLLFWVLYTFASIGTRTLVWNSAVSAVFVASRGLAIAAVLCGTALATSLAPSVAHWLIQHWGWRGGYLGLGIGWGGTALLLVLLFFRERRSTAKAAGAPQRTTASTSHGGLTVREALRTPRLYRITLAIFLQSTMGAAIIVHLVPMLTADGLSRAEAAGMAVFIGGGSVVGKLATGWLIDRFAGSLIPVACFAGPALGYLMLLQSAGSALLLSAAVLVLGYCSGASLQLTTYLTTRYGGVRNFGTIFGFISSFMALSAGIGPPLAGAIFDSTGSYSLLLMLGIPVALVAGLCVFRLGPYPVFDTKPA